MRNKKMQCQILYCSTVEIWPQKSAHSAQSYLAAQIDLAGILRHRQIDLPEKKVAMLAVNSGE